MQRFYFHISQYARMSSSYNTVTIDSKIIKSKNEYIKENLKIPIFEGMENREIQSHINDSIESDIMEFKKQMEEAAKKYYKEAQEAGETFTPYIISTSYKFTYNKNNIISISIIYYEYVDGSNYYIKTSYNFDLRTGKSLGLKDLFKEGVDYRNVINSEIRRQIKLNSDRYFPGTIESFEGIAEDQPFYLDNQSIVIYFGFHQIAPTEARIPTIKLPFNSFRGSIKPIFLNRYRYYNPYMGQRSVPCPAASPVPLSHF